MIKFLFSMMAVLAHINCQVGLMNGDHDNDIDYQRQVINGERGDKSQIHITGRNVPIKLSNALIEHQASEHRVPTPATAVQVWGW